VKGQHYADEIRQIVRRARIEAAPSPPSDKRLVAAVEEALWARSRRRILVRRRISLAVTVAAAFTLVAGARRIWRGTGASAVAESRSTARATRALTVLGTLGAAFEGANHESPVALKRGMAVGAGLTLRAPASGEVRVGTDEGTSLVLESGGELTVDEAGTTRRFTLRTGAVSARVSRLFAGERFIVDTYDAEVEVHGTAFRVAIVPAVATCGDGATTRVSVLEGIVRVRAAGREVSVFPGGSWPKGCDVTAGRPERPGVNARARITRGRSARTEDVAVVPQDQNAAEPAPAAVVAELSTVETPVLASSLAAENDLFAAALRAKKEGRLFEAAQLFGELVTSHPSSPLVEGAMVQRMKVLAVFDPAAGARVAADYLRQFSDGFARPEARELVGHPWP
jgi:FecR protein